MEHFHVMDNVLIADDRLELDNVMLLTKEIV